MKLFFGVTGAALVASSIVLAACGGDDSPAAGEPTDDAGSRDAAPVPPDTGAPDATTNGLTLAVTPDAVQVVYGGTVDIAVSIVRSGDVGDVALSVKDLPPGVTATFSPATLSAGANESTLTLSVGKEAPLGASSLNVIGSWDGSESTQKVALTVKDITVSGHIASGSEGVVVVLNDGHRSVTTTDSGGAFTFPGVKPPYDLYTVTHTDASSLVAITDHVSYYKGLTRSDPTVEAPKLGTSVVVVLPSNTATISGALSGTAAPVSSSAPLWLIWTGSPEGPAIKASGGTSYSLTRSWLGYVVTKTPGTLHAFQYDNSLRSWRGYASAAVALANSDSATVDLPMTTPVNAKIIGTVSAPSGFPTPTVAIGFQFGSSQYLAPENPLPTTLDFAIPVVSGLKMGMNVSSKLGDAISKVEFSGIDANIDITYAMKPPAELTAPADAATANSATSFEWTAPQDGVNVVRWKVGKVAYELFTTETKTSVPDVPEKRFPIDNAVWQVTTYGPTTSVDALAGPSGRTLDQALRYQTSTAGNRKFVWSP